MPAATMSFMSLLGGLVTLVGTSPNIIVSQVREQVAAMDTVDIGELNLRYCHRRMGKCAAGLLRQVGLYHGQFL